MGSVILAMGKDNRQFVTLSCINVVVASNAGGSFSPFGDITTLLVWQKEVVPFVDFFALLIPAIINFVIPATIMNFFIPKERPSAVMGGLDYHLFICINYCYFSLFRKLSSSATCSRYDVGIDLFEVF